MENLIIVQLAAVILILGIKYFSLKKQLKSVIKQFDTENTKLITAQLVTTILTKSY